MQLNSFPQSLLSLLFSAHFNLITHHLEVQGFLSFPNTSFIFLLCLFYYVYVNMLPNNHFIQSAQWKKKSVKSVARFPVDKTSSWLTRCFTYQLFVLALFRHDLCLLLFSLYWVHSNCFCINLFFGILLASSFHVWLFKQFYL